MNFKQKSTEQYRQEANRHGGFWRFRLSPSDDAAIFLEMVDCSFGGITGFISINPLERTPDSPRKDSQIFFRIHVNHSAELGRSIWVNAHGNASAYTILRSLELSIIVVQNKHKEIKPINLSIIQIQYELRRYRGATATLAAALNGWVG